MILTRVAFALAGLMTAATQTHAAPAPSSSPQSQSAASSSFSFSQVTQRIRLRPDSGLGRTPLRDMATSTPTSRRCRPPSIPIEARLRERHVDAASRQLPAPAHFGYVASSSSSSSSIGSSSDGSSSSGGGGSGGGSGGGGGGNRKSIRRLHHLSPREERDNEDELDGLGRIQLGPILHAGDAKIPLGPIIGGLVGGLLGLALIIGIVVVLLRRRRQKNHSHGKCGSGGGTSIKTGSVDGGQQHQHQQHQHQEYASPEQRYMSMNAVSPQSYAHDGGVASVSPVDEARSAEHEHPQQVQVDAPYELPAQPRQPPRGPVHEMAG